MAESVHVRGDQYKKRSPLGVWGLAWVTLGIYLFVWWYKINDEARRYLGDESIKPGLAVLALIPGAILLIPPYVSYFRTGERISRMQQKAGVRSLTSGALGILAALFLFLIAPYYQSGLNKVWDREIAAAAAAAGPPSA